MSNVLKFEFNKPETVELQSSQTLNVLGNYGSQVLYALMDGRRMYCDLKLAAKIQQFAPRPGESFVIAKHKDPQDARANTWTVWLTAESERCRAAEEAPQIAAELVEPLPANVREMKLPAESVNEPAALAPTGTDGVGWHQVSDPTDLRCSACGTPYPLNSPRMVRRLRGSGDAESATLCWVCARLKNSAEQEYRSSNQEASISK